MKTDIKISKKGIWVDMINELDDWWPQYGKTPTNIEKYMKR